MLGAPAQVGLGLRVPALDRQHEALRRVQPLVEHLGHPRAFLGIGQFGIAGIDVVRQAGFLLQPVRGILERRNDKVERHAEALRGALGEFLGIADGGLARAFDARDQRIVLPDRHAVFPPVQAESPARQALAGIPFALAIMQQAARRKARAEAPDQVVAEPALGRTDRGDVPLRAFQIVHRHEGRLAAHREADVAGGQIGIDLLAERVELLPGGFRERLGDARRLADARDRHLEAELDLGKARHAGDRRGGAEVRRGGDRDMALAGQHARGRVEADPASAGNIDLGPGVQVGEVVLDLARAFQRIDVGAKLDQIAGDKPRGEAEMAHRLDQ